MSQPCAGYGRQHEDSQPRKLRAQDLGDRLRQLAHPRLAGGGGRRHACVRQALEEGITTFDTADVYANTAAETVLGDGAARASGARGWRSSPRSTSRPAPAATTTTACRASTSWSRSTARCGGCRPTTSTSTRRTATTTRRRWRRRWRPSPTSCTPARRTTSASRSGPPTRSAAATRWPASCRIPFVSNQPQYNMLWRVIEAEVVPTSRGARHRSGRLVADRAGRADRQVPAGRAAAGRVAGHRRQGRLRHDLALAEGRRARAGAAAAADRRRGRAQPGPARGRVGAAERQRLGRDHRRQPARAGHRERQGRRA